MEKCTNASAVYKVLENGINLDYMEFREILIENAKHIYITHDIKNQCFGDYEITCVIILYSFDNFTIEINTLENIISVVNRTNNKCDYSVLPYNMPAEIENAISLLAMEG